MDLSIVIVNYNTKSVTVECINQLLKNESLQTINFEIVVVDNNSYDCSSDYFKENVHDERVKFYYNTKNEGFGKANNIGVKKALGKYILMCNSDVYCKNADLKKLYDIINSHKNIGMLGCRLVDKDGYNSNYAYNKPSLIGEFKENMLFCNNRAVKKLLRKKADLRGLYQTDWISGAFVFIRRQDFLSISGFDEKIFMYAEDMDLCLRMHKKTGKANMICDDIYVIHLRGESGGTLKYYKLVNSKQNYYYVIRKLKLSKWLPIIKLMGYYNITVIYMYKKISGTVKSLKEL